MTRAAQRVRAYNLDDCFRDVIRVIPNAPGEAGGRGTLRRLAVRMRCTGLHSAHAAPPSPPTPMQMDEDRKVPLVRA
jgi:hypothetical protein